MRGHSRTDATLANLERLGYRAMTPIQAVSLPIALAGHDLIAQAKTGTGKTRPSRLVLLSNAKASGSGVQALVLCPTRLLGVLCASVVFLRRRRTTEAQRTRRSAEKK